VEGPAYRRRRDAYTSATGEKMVGPWRGGRVPWRHRFTHGEQHPRPAHRRGDRRQHEVPLQRRDFDRGCAPAGPCEAPAHRGAGAEAAGALAAGHVGRAAHQGLDTPAGPAGADLACAAQQRDARRLAAQGRPAPAAQAPLHLRRAASPLGVDAFSPAPDGRRVAVSPSRARTSRCRT
jgi:hypothetical protein